MMHLDGARLWNAAVATGHSLATLAAPFDTVSVCFSKGLGAPIGSALVGPREFIARAKRIRKLFGGAMRQGGIVAAAALYALEHHFDRLAEDHRHAQILADAVESSPGLSLEFGSVETNLVWIVVDPQVATPKAVVDALRARGVWMSALGSRQIRACTHLDVSMEEAMYAAEQLRAVMQEMAAIAA